MGGRGIYPVGIDRNIIPTLIQILLYPSLLTRLVLAVYDLCVPKGFNMFLHNIYKVLLHPSPLTGFVLAMCTDCILKGLQMCAYTNYLKDWIT